MASDLSSGCNEAVEALDEKEEGEISLEDVSSSEEGHVNYAYGVRGAPIARCLSCSSKQHCATWCTSAAKHHHSKNQCRRDAVQGKENRHHTKEPGSTGSKYPATTLQEKNDDLVPISSDSDMEVVGLADSTKIIPHSLTRSKVRKKKKRRKSRSPGLRASDVAPPSVAELPEVEYSDTSKHKSDTTKGNHLPRSFHRETSPIHRPGRSHIIKRSPLKRYRSPPGRGRSPVKRSRSPILRARSPVTRKSPRSTRSPRRSPYRSPLLLMRRKVQRPITSPLSRTSGESHNDLTQQLLKKVRDFKESIETQCIETSIKRNKEHASSLKEKLSNMLKTMSDDNENVTHSTTESNTADKKSNDRDDEEDLALLRQKALETKQSKANKPSSQCQNENIKKSIETINDDQDEEDLKLRMIALRSAVMKKHQDRVQRRIKSGKVKKSTIIRSESPFTDSFLDSIPIPHGNYMSPPHTPPNLNENNHEEDMELDTDVEREKERLPYSPTDKIMTNMPIDTEMLGIQATDISFVPPNATNNSYMFPAKYNGENQNTLQPNVYYDNGYLPNLNEPTCEVNNADAPYSPSDSIDTHIIPNERTTLSCVPLSKLLEASMKQQCERTEIYTDPNTYTRLNSSQDMPYSPSDTTVYNASLAQLVPPTNTFGSSDGLTSGDYFDTEVRENLGEQRSSSIRSDLSLSEKDHLTDRVSEDIDTISVNPAVGSAVSSPIQSLSPNGSMITIDDIMGTDIDASPTPIVAVDSETSAEYMPSNASNETKDSEEPLYMQGVPDITKDTNKIPTLINRRLVPARILKANKQLQQPLLPKKPEIVQPEPTFKSADMQPVSINAEAAKCNIPFKSIKLVQPTKKSYSVLPTSAAFDTLDEEISKGTPENDSAVRQESKDLMDLEKHAETSLSCKRKKLRKRRSTPRTNATTQLVDKRSNSETSTSNKNKNPVVSKVADRSESAQTVPETCTKNQQRTSDDHNKNQEAAIDQTQKDDQKGQTKDKESRRRSIDEDEDELRALLLASMAKRTKLNDNVVSTAPPVSLATSTTETNTTSVLNKAPLQSTTANDAPRVPNTTSLVANQSTTVNISESDKIICNSTLVANLEITKEVFPNITVEVPTAQLSQTAVKKRSITTGKSPMKKIIRKVSVPASTKVVNNAKKYQNMIVQRRLNLQKATNLYNAQRQNRTLSTTKVSDTKWSASTKSTGVLDTQRFVISLGSDTESDSESDQANSNLITNKERPQTLIPKSDFEKSIDEFLREARKKQESAAAKPASPVAAATKNLTKTILDREQSSTLDTPPAVRHLPASRQQEYHRLKQQIIEHEKLKQKRKTEGNHNSSPTKVNIVPNILSSPNAVKSSLPSVQNQSTSVQSQNVNSLNLKATAENGEAKSVDSVNVSPSKTVKPIAINQASLQNKVPTKKLTDNNTQLVIKSAQSEVGSDGTKTLTPTTCEKEHDKATASDVVKAPSLTVLTRDEVNNKYLQAQQRRDTVQTPSPTVVAKSINKVAQTNNSSSNDNYNVVNTNVNTTKNTENPDASDPKNSVASNEQVIDSDASTLILSQTQATKLANESTDTDETTLTLSQYLATENNETSTKNVDTREKTSTEGVKSNIKEFWDTMKKDSVKELRGLTSLSQDEQKKRLMDTEHKLVMKRYTVLDDLAEMLGNLRQWDMERDLQTSLVAEVKKLREQLKIAEERLAEQSNRINSLTPKVLATKEKIHDGRLECYKLSRICSGLGTQVIGQDYKVPEAGAHLLENRVKEVAAHSRELSKKRVPSIDLPGINAPITPIHKIISTIETENTQETVQLDKIPISTENEESSSSSPMESEENTSKQMDDTCLTQPELTSTPRVVIEHGEKDSTQEPMETSESSACIQSNRKLQPLRQETGHPPKKSYTPYISILTHFKAPRNTNLDGILCPYELRGTCSDGDCQFVHYASSQDR